MKQLIVNADDFGISSSVDRGIIDTFKRGIVRSTSLVANGANFSNAVESLKNNPDLGVGIHLNILRGMPVSHPLKVKHLLDKEHFSLTISSLLRKAHHHILMKEIEIEYRAQIERILKNFKRVTHIDSEKHHHSLPKIFELVCRLAHEYQIKHIRFINETNSISKNLYKCLGLIWLNIFAAINKKYVRQWEINTADYFWGVQLAGQMTKSNLIKILLHIQDGVNEICCHPGYIDDRHSKCLKGFGNFYIDKHREEELEILCSSEIREQLKLNGIHLTHYGLILK